MIFNPGWLYQPGLEVVALGLGLETPLAPFGLPYIRLVRLLFSAGTMFFSYNNSARTVFIS